MLATLIEKPFDREGWIFEIKWDGFRAIAERAKNGLEIYFRNGLSFNDRFPVIVKELEKIRRHFIIDGEIVRLDEKGRPRFQFIQNEEGDLRYYVFDILSLDGKDLTTLPLIDRKAILKKFLGRRKRIVYSDHVETRGIEFFRFAEKEGLEGIVGKNRASPYRVGRRSADWVKIKAQMRQEAVIVGFTEPKGSRKYFGSLVLGAYAAGKLLFIGRSGGGFTEKALRDIHKRLGKLSRETSPLHNPPRARDITWVQPKLVCEVSFTEWTSDGQMRHPVFLGLREDKSAHEVIRE